MTWNAIPESTQSSRVYVKKKPNTPKRFIKEVTADEPAWAWNKSGCFLLNYMHSPNLNLKRKHELETLNSKKFSRFEDVDRGCIIC